MMVWMGKQIRTITRAGCVAGLIWWTFFCAVQYTDIIHQRELQLRSGEMQFEIYKFQHRLKLEEYLGELRWAGESNRLQRLNR